MPRYSAFTMYGHLAYSSRVPPAQSIYESMLAGEGGTFSTDFNSTQGARRYAQAMCLAAAKLQIDRARNNAIPLKAIELLPELERDYQVTPAYNASIRDRQEAVAARARLTRGARAESLDDALRQLLGDDFISIEPLSGTDVKLYPNPPDDIAVFAAPGMRKKGFIVTEAVSILGVFTSVHWTAIAGSEAPVVGEAYTMDPNDRGNPEQIIINAVAATTLTTRFNKPHEPGTVAVRPHAMWSSTRRYNLITLTASAAQDPETRRKVNELMARMLRGVSQWGIVGNNGNFVLDTVGRCALSSTKLA